MASAALVAVVIRVGVKDIELVGKILSVVCIWCDRSVCSGLGGDSGNSNSRSSSSKSGSSDCRNSTSCNSISSSNE